MLPSLAHALSNLSGPSTAWASPAWPWTISQILEKWTIHTTFIQGFSIGLLFLGAIALNARKERFWCRYLCPTGALLGLLSRWNLLKLQIDDEKCIKCGLCTQHCETQAHPYPNDKWKRRVHRLRELRFDPPDGRDRLPVLAKPEKLTNVSNVDLSRRKLLLTTIAGLVGVPCRPTPSAREVLPQAHPAARRVPERSSWPSASSAASA